MKITQFLKSFSDSQPHNAYHDTFRKYLCNKYSKLLMLTDTNKNNWKTANEI